MTKELLENLLIEFDEMGFEPTTLCDSQREVDSFRNRLKQVLDYLKSIDNANPSEALDSLEDMAKYRIEYSDYSMPIKDISEYKKIKQALLKAQEQEKVLEILKEKRVDLSYLRCCIEDNQSVERYNEYIRNKTMDYDHEEELTEDEFNLIKRYFK